MPAPVWFESVRLLLITPGTFVQVVLEIAGLACNTKPGSVVKGQLSVTLVPLRGDVRGPVRANCSVGAGTAARAMYRTALMNICAPSGSRS